MNEDALISAASLTAIVITGVMALKRRKRRAKKVWTRSWLSKRHMGRGILNMLNTELINDRNSYQSFLRLNIEQFNWLLQAIECHISKRDTFMRQAISARNKLEITLRFLATGESYRSLMYSSRIHESTISKFVPDVCEAIINYLRNIYLNTPTKVEDWLNIADNFNNMWNFPHCLGALDGRHVTFRAPISDGSYYYNYKGQHSLVLLALVDANYKFIYVNIGSNGRVSDGGVYQQCQLSNAMEKNLLNFPPPDYLPGGQTKVPYVIVADDAFPLGEHLMKPYPQRGLTHECRIFNYRLSRARRIVENSFGLLVNRFRVLLTPINLSAAKVEKIILCCVLLHNFLCTSNNNGAMGNVTEISHSDNNLRAMCQQGGNQSTNFSRDIRDEFKKFFNSPEGRVEWQDQAIANNNM